MNALNEHTELEPHIKLAIHGRFYRWAKARVEGKNVLDAGCGLGHGAMILAESAAMVTGIDKEPSMVLAAREYTERRNLSFEVVDCETMSFEPGSFDIVVSNALLEYLEDVRAFFEGVHRVLKPGGLFICGTKNRLLSLKNPDGTPRYREHRQEYSPDELTVEMQSYFDNVKMYGEQMNKRSQAYIMNRHALKIEDQLVRLNIKQLFPSRLRRYVRELVTGVALIDVVHDDFEIVESGVEEALYIIGVAEKGCGT